MKRYILALALIAFAFPLDAQETPLAFDAAFGDTSLVHQWWNAGEPDGRVASLACNMFSGTALTWSIDASTNVQVGPDSIGIVASVPTNARLIVTAGVDRNNLTYLGALNGPLDMGHYSFAFKRPYNGPARFIRIDFPPTKSLGVDNEWNVYARIDNAYQKMRTLSVAQQHDSTEITRWYSLPFGGVVKELWGSAIYTGTMADAVKDLPSGIYISERGVRIAK